ncbi:hypothetical protein AAVH_34272 [Aphelenchoides avenae]|nr:hypothetical protein AAVH_34272 [Aphelenchus avenae]
MKLPLLLLLLAVMVLIVPVVSSVTYSKLYRSCKAPCELRMVQVLGTSSRSVQCQCPLVRYSITKPAPTRHRRQRIEDSSVDVEESGSSDANSREDPLYYDGPD